MKAARHELKGMRELQKCGVRDLRLPLVATLDYRGISHSHSFTHAVCNVVECR